MCSVEEPVVGRGVEKFNWLIQMSEEVKEIIVKLSKVNVRIVIKGNVWFYRLVSGSRSS